MEKNKKFFMTDIFWNILFGRSLSRNANVLGYMEQKNINA